MPFTLVHLSDLHFHRLPRHVRQWLGKQGVGALNLMLRRGREFPFDRAQRMVAHVDALEWDHLVISGDLTTLATEEEFALARRTLAPLLDRGPERVTVIPGNHDRYVPQPPGRDLFTEHFGAFFGDGEITTRALPDGWHLAGWDSAVPRPPLVAAGRVREETLRATEAWLAGLPTGGRAIVVNHYPLYFHPPYRFKRLHELPDLPHLREWLTRQPAVRLYLHGHLHRNWVLEVPGAGGAITCINSAASTARPRPDDPSAFHRLHFDGDRVRVEPMQYT